MKDDLLKDELSETANVLDDGILGLHKTTHFSHSVDPFSRVAIIGLGLIGASLAGALKKAYHDIYILGVDIDSSTCARATELGWADCALLADDEGLSDALSKCELVVISTPIAHVDDYFHLLDDIGFTGVITDTVSTKAHILQASSDILNNPSIYIPGHPMTGAETSGIDGAHIDLFEGANWILCPDEKTDPEMFQRLHELICGLSARVVSISREDHDRAVAVVSHVPHIVASSLMRLACAHSDEGGTLMRLAAGGFKDSTRVAAGSPKLWCGIAFDNRCALSDGLSEIEDIIASFRAALDENDRETFTSLLAQAADARRALPAQWVPSSEKMLEVRIPMVNRTGIIAEVATIASSVGCNIQSIEIDHISEGNAVLSLLLTDEGDIGQLSCKLIEAGHSVSFSPVRPKEYSHVE